jgi:hypothetical protein
MACKNCEHFKERECKEKYGWQGKPKCCIKLFDGIKEYELDDNAHGIEYFVPEDDFSCIFDTSQTIMTQET